MDRNRTEIEGMKWVERDCNEMNTITVLTVMPNNH